MKFTKLMSTPITISVIVFGWIVNCCCFNLAENSGSNLGSISVIITSNSYKMQNEIA